MDLRIFLGLLLNTLVANALMSHQRSASALITLAVCSSNIGVSHGFFGFFRRRTTPKAPSRIPSILEEVPAGANQGLFPFFQGGGLFSNPLNPFQFGSGSNFMQQQQQQNAQKPPGSPFQGHSFQSGSFQDQVAQQMNQQNIPHSMQQEVFKQMQQNPPVPDQDFGRDESEGNPGVNVDEAESFFTLLAETDESQCISRLVCEMGADPLNSGDFGQTIVEMIGNLRDFPSGSKVAQYNNILQLGVEKGISECTSRFSSCDDESLQMVKNAQVGD